MKARASSGTPHFRSPSNENYELNSLAEDVFRGHQLGNFDADARALAFAAGNIHSEIVAVEHAQALVHVADADSILKHLRHALGRNPDAVVFDFNDQAAVLRRVRMVDLAAVEFGGQSMLQRIFDDGLQQHAGNEGIERVRAQSA